MLASPFFVLAVSSTKGVLVEVCLFIPTGEPQNGNAVLSSHLQRTCYRGGVFTADDQTSPRLW